MQLDNAQQPAPYLFLNVSGVLTNGASAWLTGEDVLDTTALRLIEKLCKELGAKVVMATSWVAMYATPDAWCALFKEHGVDIPVVDVLPEGGMWWGHKAQGYMQAHRGTRWAMLTDGFAPPHLGAIIGTNAAAGVTTKELERVAEALAPKSKVALELRALNEPLRK
jgi:hypothetical protein